MAQPEAESVSDRSLVVNNELKNFWRDFLHVDVKKDHKSDYDRDVVESLLPGGGGSDANGKEGLFHRLILKENGETIAADRIASYGAFQNAVGLDAATGKLPGIDKIKVAHAGYTYQYKYFDRPRDGGKTFETVAQEINAFLGAKKIFRYTDTSRGGAEFLCAYPTEADGSPLLLHANTREVESDPASKLSRGSLTTCVGDKADKLFFYEPAENPLNIVYPKWEEGAANNSALAAFYCSKTLVMKLKGVKPNGKLDVQLTFYNADNRLIEITEKMNIASSFKKLVSNIKQFLNIKTPADLKQAIFISKHHGDIGQVLSPFYPRKLQNLKGNQIVSNKYLSCFESYDVNPLLKAFSVGEDIIWFHTSPSNGKPAEQRIIIFKREGLDSPEDFVTYLNDQFIAEKIKAITLLDAYLAAASVVNTVIKRFKLLFLAHFDLDNIPEGTDKALIAVGTTWRQSVTDNKNVNARYGMILQKASEFAVLSKSLPTALLDNDAATESMRIIGEINVEGADKIKTTVEEVKAAVAAADEDAKTAARQVLNPIKSALQAALKNITTEIQKYSFPKEQLDASQRIFRGDRLYELAATTIQKDIAVISDAAYKGFTKKTMANMWSFINVKGGRSRVVSFEPKRITAFGLKAIHLIKKSLDEFEGAETYSGAFITMLKASAAPGTAGSSEDIARDINTTIDLLLPDGAAAKAFVGGRRRTRKQRGGQQQLQLLMPRDRKLEIMMELLKDCKIYFTFVLDNMANPSKTLSQMDTFLQDMHGIKLDFSETEEDEFNLRGGGEEEIIDRFEPSPNLSDNLDETFFEGENRAGEYSYGMISPSYTHFQTLFKEMCKAFSEPKLRSALVEKRDALYELMYVMQQFGMIMNLSAAQLDTEDFEEYKNFEQEIENTKEELSKTNFFADCGIFRETFQEAIGFPAAAAGAGAGEAGAAQAKARGEIFRGINQQVLEEIASRLVVKLNEGAAVFGILGLGAQPEQARQLFEAEVNYGKALSNLKDLEEKRENAQNAKDALEVLIQKVLANDNVKKEADDALAGAQKGSKASFDKAEKALEAAISLTESEKAAKAAGATDELIAAYRNVKNKKQKANSVVKLGKRGLDNLYEGGARKTRRKRKNESKHRRKTKSKTKHVSRV
jgi:hypothetical protein